jgi:hypothetical protein
LRYSERRGDKCHRRDRRLIRFDDSGEFGVAHSPAIVPPRGCPAAAPFAPVSAKPCFADGFVISKYRIYALLDFVIVPTYVTDRKIRKDGYIGSQT